VPYIGFAFTDNALDFLADLPPKLRRQVIKKAKALHSEPHPPTSKKLHDVETPDGEAVYRERSGDYRILYVVRTKPEEVVIIEIDHRKDVYRMPKTNPEPADEMRMKQGDFDEIMRGALGAPPPPEKLDAEGKPSSKRLSAFPAKRRRG
jgi:mRNA interferase RelE/StbE